MIIVNNFHRGRCVHVRGAVKLLEFLKTIQVKHCSCTSIGLTCSGVTGAGADRPARHHPGDDTRVKLFFLRLKLQRTIDKRWKAERVDVVTRRKTIAKKVVSFQRIMTKMRQNRVTPSVAAPGDTNLSDATAEL